jgi:hypothetical protein
VAKKATIRWYGKQVSAKVKAAGFKGLRRATAYVQRKVKVAISKPAMVGGGGAKSPSRKRKTKPRRYQHSKAGQPPRAITGKLRQSIFQSTDRKRMLGSVGTTLKYGAGLERGTKPHGIRARRKKVLVFGGETPGGWGWIFRKRVSHPGVKPRPYLWATVKKEKAKIKSLIFGEMKKAMHGQVKLGI